MIQKIGLSNHPLNPLGHRPVPANGKKEPPVTCLEIRRHPHPIRRRDSQRHRVVYRKILDHNQLRYREIHRFLDLI